MKTRARFRPKNHKSSLSQPKLRPLCEHAQLSSCAEQDDYDGGSHYSVRMKTIITVATVTAVGLYLSTIYADFAYDDSRAIIKNQDLKPETPIGDIFQNDFWGTPLQHSGSHKSYRPLVVLTFRLNYLLQGLTPSGFHLANALLHGVATVLYTYVVWWLTRNEFRTLCAGFLFAVHPINSEAVAGIVGRADILAAIFFLVTFLLYSRYCAVRKTGSKRRWLMLVCCFVSTLASMLSKEYGVTVLGVCFIYDKLITTRRRQQDNCRSISHKLVQQLCDEGTVFLAFTGLALIGFRLYLMDCKPPEFSPSDNPAADSESLLTRTLTFLYLPCLNFALLVYPKTLSFDWSMDSVPLVESLADHRVLYMALFYAFVCYVFAYIMSFYTQSHQKEEDCQRTNTKNDIYQSVIHTSSGSVTKITTSIKTNKQLTNTDLKTCCQFPSNGPMTTNGYMITSADESKVTHRKQRRSSNSSDDMFIMDANHNHVLVSGSSERHLAALVMGSALLVLPFIPASNLLFYVGFVIAERILYIPCMGFCLLTAELVYKICKHFKTKQVCLAQIFQGLLVAVAILLSFRTHLRCQDWMNEESLYRSGISVNPAKAWGNLANVLNNEGRIEEAEKAYRSALKYRSNMADVHYNLGILLQNQSRNAEAIEEYELAIQCRPRLTVAHLNLGIVQAQLGQHDEAIKSYLRCVDIDIHGLKDPRMHESAKVSALYNLGRLYAEKQSYAEAVHSYNKALSIRPDHYAPQSIYNLLGEAHYNFGNLESAEKWYKKSLEAKPDHVPAHLTMGKLLHHKGNQVDAQFWYIKALQLDPNDPTNYQHYAHFLSEVGRHSDALVQWLTAVELMPDNLDVVFSTANACRQVGKNAEAEMYYEKAVALAPKSAKAHMNLGAIYHLNKKYAEAEKSYQTALVIDPSDKITQNNLQKLKNLRKKTT